MPYTIGHFVYGIDLTTEPYNPLPEDDALNEATDFVINEDCNKYGDDEFITRTYQCDYTYFGISKMEMDIDETSSFTKIQLLGRINTCQTYKKEYKKKLEAFLKQDGIPQSLKEYVKNRKPEVFLCWGTS